MSRLRSATMLLAVWVMCASSSQVTAGVVLKTPWPEPTPEWSFLSPWITGPHGLENPNCEGGFGCGEASGGEGIYFGFTSDLEWSDSRMYIPYLPKYPNVVIPEDSLWLTSFSSLPGELYTEGIGDWYYTDYSGSEAHVNVPVGTTLTFYENDYNNRFNHSTLYRTVGGVLIPIEEFRQLTGDGPGYFTLDSIETIDLISFDFYSGNGVYPGPGYPIVPMLVHIHVVPEPGTLLMALGLMSLGLCRRRR